MPRVRSSPKLYSSPNARVPAHWGQRTWDALFLLAADYPHVKDCDDDDEYPQQYITERQRAWKRLFESLPGVLTCSVCSHHFKEYMKRDKGVPFKNALRDRKALFKWLHQAKKEVNDRNGRKSRTLMEIEKKYIPRC